MFVFLIYQVSVPKRGARSRFLLDPALVDRDTVSGMSLVVNERFYMLGDPIHNLLAVLVE